MGEGDHTDCTNYNRWTYMGAKYWTTTFFLHTTACMHTRTHTGKHTHSTNWTSAHTHTHRILHASHFSPSDGGRAFSICFHGPTSWLSCGNICMTSPAKSASLLEETSPWQSHSALNISCNICLNRIRSEITDKLFYLYYILYTLLSLSGNWGRLTWVRLQQPQEQHNPVLQVHTGSFIFL